MPSGQLATFVNTARLQVDEALERYLPSPPASPAIVSDAMRYSVFAGGKRLRPVLALASADAVGRLGGSAYTIDLAMPAAGAEGHCPVLNPLRPQRPRR